MAGFTSRARPLAGLGWIYEVPCSMTENARPPHTLARLALDCWPTVQLERTASVWAHTQKGYYSVYRACDSHGVMK